MEYLALKNIIRKKHTRRREILSFGDRMKGKKMATALFFFGFLLLGCKTWRRERHDSRKQLIF
jgi:hypothetical protein